MIKKIKLTRDFRTNVTNVVKGTTLEAYEVFTVAATVGYQVIEEPMLGAMIRPHECIVLYEEEEEIENVTDLFEDIDEKIAVWLESEFEGSLVQDRQKFSRELVGFIQDKLTNS